MKSKSNFTKAERIWTGLFFSVLGLIAVYSQTISSYLIDAYNQNVEFLANNTVSSTNILRY